MTIRIIFAFALVLLILLGCSPAEVPEDEGTQNITVEENIEKQPRPDYFKEMYRDRHKDEQRHHWED